MNWHKHYTKSEHAFLGASDYHWLNYDEKRLKERWYTKQAVLEGTAAHEYAAMAIKHAWRQKQSKKTLFNYINDAISFRMSPEVMLYYSENCFGTADAIAYSEEDKFLRIHDLKTGKVPAKMDQLLIYTALFCLDYDIRPGDISCELRIYQNDEIIIYEPTTEEVSHIMSKIVSFDKVIARLKAQEG